MPVDNAVAATGTFPLAYSEAEDWAHIAKELSDGLGDTPPGGLGILYVTDHVADGFKSIVTFLKQTTGVDTWIGTLGLGVVAGARTAFDRPAAVAMVVTVPSAGYRLIPHTPIPDRWPEDLVQWSETVTPMAGLVHADGAVPSLADVIEALAERTGAYLVGGLTCSRSAQHQLAGDVVSGGVSGALFAPDVPVTVGLTQGCSPLGPARSVTAGEGNVIMEIDGQPALQVFREDIGEMLARDLQRVAGYVHVAFPVSGADTADYLVRNLMGIDPEHQWLAVGTEVAAGDRIMFVRRDPMSAQNDLNRMLNDVVDRLQGPARGAVYVSCVARGPGMFGSEAAEAEMVTEMLGDVPIIGFYANGEISHDRLYGYTGVLLVFG